MQEGEESAMGETSAESQEKLSGWQKAGKWVGNNWIFRNVILPHDPQDPFPWDEGLSAGQRARAFTTLTGEAISQSRSFVNHLASWGGSTEPDGSTSSNRNASGQSNANSSTSMHGEQGLDPTHKSSSATPYPYSPPSPPALDLPGR
jgi:hypothetical protein